MNDDRPRAPDDLNRDYLRGDRPGPISVPPRERTTIDVIDATAYRVGGVHLVTVVHGQTVSARCTCDDLAIPERDDDATCARCGGRLDDVDADVGRTADVAHCCSCRHATACTHAMAALATHKGLPA